MRRANDNGIQVNFDFDLTLCDPIKAYEKAIKEVLDIEIDLDNISSQGDVKKEILKQSFKELLNLNFKPLKKIFFKREKTKSEINEKILLKYYEEIKFDKKLEKTFQELYEEGYSINIISNNNTQILTTKEWPGKEFVDCILWPPLIKEKPSGDWINLLPNKDPMDNFVIGDSWKDMKAGLNAGLPKDNLIGFNKYNQKGNLEKYTNNIYDDLKKVKEYIFERTKI